MNFREFLKENRVYLDGGMGTLLQAKGLKPGELPERWNITHPDVVKDIHKAYFEAGSNVVCANTFGANPLKFSDDELEKIISAAIKNAKDAIAETGDSENKFVAFDMGSLGKLLKPLGDLSFEDAVSAFSKTVKLGGDTFNENIIRFIKKNYALLINENTAEEIKIKIGNVFDPDENESLDVKGINLLDSLPKTINISSADIYPALIKTALNISLEISSVLENAPHSLILDIADDKIILSGGGALLKGFDKLIEKETKIKTVLSENALYNNVLGLGKAMSKISKPKLFKSFMPSKENILTNH